MAVRLYGDGLRGRDAPTLRSKVPRPRPPGVVPGSCVSWAEHIKYVLTCVLSRIFIMDSLSVVHFHIGIGPTRESRRAGRAGDVCTPVIPCPHHGSRGVRCGDAGAARGVQCVVCSTLNTNHFRAKQNVARPVLSSVLSTHRHTTPRRSQKLRKERKPTHGLPTLWRLGRAARPCGKHEQP